MPIYYLCGVPFCSNYIAHHGIVGMKWGIRRYQNRDGTYTPEGRKRYSKSGSGESTKYGDSSGSSSFRKTLVGEGKFGIGAKDLTRKAIENYKKGIDAAKKAGNKEKVAKYQREIKKNQLYLDASDRYEKSVSTGRLFLQNMMFFGNDLAAMRYRAMLGMGVNKGKAFAVGFIAGPWATYALSSYEAGKRVDAASRRR